MIARRWTGRVAATRGDEYLAYLQKTGLRDLAATPGNLGVTVLSRTAGETTWFELTSFWESTDAIRAFAGDDISIARYYPEDAEFLLEMPERLEHWEVAQR
ncbi:MAG TPA: antibiotic biosynthesis monooxygenase [Candidatus Limnocylindria bacterium]